MSAIDLRATASRLGCWTVCAAMSLGVWSAVIGGVRWVLAR